MKLLLEIIILLVGFLFLIKGADYFVDGSSAVAKKLKVPTIVIGLTIVAIGTSLPELAVSAFASAQGSNAMSFSNVVGSNIFNLLMVLGVSSIFISIKVKNTIIRREFPFLLVITFIALFLAGDALWFGGVMGKVNIFSFANIDLSIGEVNRVDGILLLVMFAGFIWWTVSYALKERKKAIDSHEGIEETTESGAKCAAYIIGGAIAIVFGGQLVVNSAKYLAGAAGMSETLIGLTVVALGTSLPELVTSAVAAKKGEADLAVGNVVGSNIANTLLVLGVSAAISPVGVATMSLIDVMISIIVVVIVYAMAVTKRTIRRGEGFILIAVYLVYMVYIVCRQM